MRRDWQFNQAIETKSWGHAALAAMAVNQTRAFFTTPVV